MCCTNVLKPLETLCTFQDTTQSSRFSLRMRNVSGEFFPTCQQNVAGGTLLSIPQPCIGAFGSFSKLLIRMTQDFAALVAQYIRLTVHSGFLQERLGSEHVT